MEIFIFLGILALLILTIPSIWIGRQTVTHPLVVALYTIMGFAVVAFIPGFIIVTQLTKAH